MNGLPENITITSAEVRDALSEPLSKIIDAIKGTLENVPPELSADIIDDGIKLTGGGSILRGIDSLINRETGIPVFKAECPMDCVVKGIGKIMEEPKKYRYAISEEPRYL
jgi:rod shape-determining protein MreB